MQRSRPREVTRASERAIILQCMRSRQKRAFILDLDDRFPGFDPSSRACGSFALP